MQITRLSRYRVPVLFMRGGGMGMDKLVLVIPRNIIHLKSCKIRRDRVI